MFGLGTIGFVNPPFSSLSRRRRLPEGLPRRRGSSQESSNRNVARRELISAVLIHDRTSEHHHAYRILAKVQFTSKNSDLAGWAARRECNTNRRRVESRRQDLVSTLRRSSSTILRLRALHINEHIIRYGASEQISIIVIAQ
jgi:hypothetical protein